MGSRARRISVVPGPPTREMLAYLAGWIDAKGGFTTTPPGIKLRCGLGPGLLLEGHFGGHFYWSVFGQSTGGTWCLRTQAEVLDTLQRLRPFVHGRELELDAMILLVQHHRHRVSYNGSLDWHAERARLAAGVRAGF